MRRSPDLEMDPRQRGMRRNLTQAGSSLVLEDGLDQRHLQRSSSMEANLPLYRYCGILLWLPRPRLENTLEIFFFWETRSLGRGLVMLFGHPERLFLVIRSPDRSPGYTSSRCRGCVCVFLLMNVTIVFIGYDLVFQLFSPTGRENFRKQVATMMGAWVPRFSHENSLTIIKSLCFVGVVCGSLGIAREPFCNLLPFLMNPCSSKCEFLCVVSLIHGFRTSCGLR